MDQQNLRVRLAALRQKSLKALGLYRRIGRSASTERARLSELQMAEWRIVSADLGKRLETCVREASYKSLSVKSFALRDHFLSHWRAAQAALRARRDELPKLLERGDFIKATLLCQELITLRAREQACQAAYSELQNLLSDKSDRRGKAEREAQDLEEGSAADSPVAQIIPLRRAK